MLALKEPLGRFIAVANLEKGLIEEPNTEQNIANLVDLIAIRIQNNPIETVAESLLEQLFNLRFSIVKWMSKHDKDLSTYLESLNQHIAINLQKAPYDLLAATISKILLAYEQILSPKLNEVPSSLEHIASSTDYSDLSYQMFQVLAAHPSPQIKYLKNWLDASLELEIGLIMSDLILTKQIEFTQEYITSDLVEFLYNSITKFGAYSIFTGFWQPIAEDDSNLTNQMQILAATLELDHKPFLKTTKESLSQLLN